MFQRCLGSSCGCRMLSKTFKTSFTLWRRFCGSWCFGMISLTLQPTSCFNDVSVARAVMACFQRTSRLLSRSDGFLEVRAKEVIFRWLSRRSWLSESDSVVLDVAAHCPTHSRRYLRCDSVSAALEAEFQALLNFHLLSVIADTMHFWCLWKGMPFLVAKLIIKLPVTDANTIIY